MSYVNPYLLAVGQKTNTLPPNPMLHRQRAAAIPRHPDVTHYQQELFDKKEDEKAALVVAIVALGGFFLYRMYRR